MIATASGRTAAATRLAAWLETMRCPGTADGLSGYGGPVVHWWRDSLLFCGPGLDWRYEGIILGYLALSARTGQGYWLERAKRAGDDLVAAQLPNGSFRWSGFERNPVSAGTPHEAAADVALLALAATLRRATGTGRAAPDGSVYLAAARRNLEAFYVARLWDGDARLFRDDAGGTSFVPNKAATLAEALFRLADVCGEERWVTRYARPTLDAVLRHQVQRPGDALDGAIAQYSIGRSVVARYFPYYVARCVPALVEAAARFGDRRYLDAAVAAGRFVLRWRDPDGAFPQVIYSGGRVNRYPRWIAGTGDVLRALELLRPHGLVADLRPTRRWLLAGQLPTGAFRAAEGFGWRASQQRQGGAPDARDLLPVVGWNDKALRYLAGPAGADPGWGDVAPPVAVSGTGGGTLELSCTWFGRPAVYREDETVAEVVADGRRRFHWRKGDVWAQAIADRRGGDGNPWA